MIYVEAKYVAPSFKADAFHCPHCGVYSHQLWPERTLYDPGSGMSYHDIKGLTVSICMRCTNYALWLNGKMISPISSIAPLPIEDMPADVGEDFLEARNIVNTSPRASAALLRLALQKLMPHLGEKGENINDDIASLVRKGLPEKMQKALDSLRVIGNNAVHPGQIDLKDDAQTAIALFDLLNMIVEVMITQPKKVDQIYDKLPSSIQDAIKKRDKKP